ncbi:hypothetical protein [Arthrobacter zhaoguopingii]|uniref:hypothetical protein n=1 Tax=Arthrobacter zhaoguopingii TaxID=2681491 RepID=UPI00135C95B0|nr:hypothetical protein [Arthrobacter zhaoguopingii]
MPEGTTLRWRRASGRGLTATRGRDGHGRVLITNGFLFANTAKWDTGRLAFELAGAEPVDVS